VTGRDDARAHPSLDELADLREGLLSASDSEWVRAHVDSCSSCAAGLSALDDVTGALRETGAQPVAMPAAVARAIDDAISEEAVKPRSVFAPRPTEAPTARRPQRRPWFKPVFGWLAGAAATVVVIGGAVSLGERAANDSEAGGSSADRAVAGQEQAPSTPSTVRPDDRGKHLDDLRVVDQKLLPKFARDLAGETAAPTAGGGAAAYRAACSLPHRMGGLERRVLWYGDAAVVVVRREARVASVYSCDPTPRLLYSAPY
jgi:hypothetical protein